MAGLGIRHTGTVWEGTWLIDADKGKGVSLVEDGAKCCSRDSTVWRLYKVGLVYVKKSRKASGTQRSLVTWGQWWKTEAERIKIIRIWVMTESHWKNLGRVVDYLLKIYCFQIFQSFKKSLKETLLWPFIPDLSFFYLCYICNLILSLFI